MAKKTDRTTKPEAPAKRAVKPTAKIAKPGKSAKTAVAKRKIATRAPKPPYTRHEVALRAYFISEKRQAHGLPGDERQDWLEAERQLAAESGGLKKVKRA